MLRSAETSVIELQTRCAKSQKNRGLYCTVAKAWNLTILSSIPHISRSWLGLENNCPYSGFSYIFLVPAGKYRDRDVNCNFLPATSNLLCDLNYSILSAEVPTVSYMKNTL